jgi:hypothetical protein
MLTSQQQVQQRQVQQLQRQEQRQEQKRLQLQEQQELQLQEPEQQRVFQRLFRHMRSKQEPTEQQREQKVSL